MLISLILREFALSWNMGCGSLRGWVREDGRRGGGDGKGKGGEGRGGRGECGGD